MGAPCWAPSPKYCGVFDGRVHTDAHIQTDSVDMFVIVLVREQRMCRGSRD